MTATIRRIASRTVAKSRQGNAFMWSIQPVQSPSATVSESDVPTPSEFESDYAHLSQSERLHLIAQRATLNLDDFIELTDIEAVAVLEGDDEGLYTLPGITNGAPGALPY